LNREGKMCPGKELGTSPIQFQRGIPRWSQVWQLSYESVLEGFRALQEEQQLQEQEQEQESIRTSAYVPQHLRSEQEREWHWG
jgi:hypothetical protein